MNIESRLDPRRETDDRPLRERSLRRAFLRAALFLLLLLLWWYFTIPGTPAGGSGHGSGPGSALSGDGPGSGDHGDQAGADDHGEAGQTGQTDNAPRQNSPSGTGDAAHDAGGGEAANTPEQNQPPAPEPSEMAKQLEAYGKNAAHPLQTEPTSQARGGTRGSGAAAGPAGSSGNSGYRGFYGLKVSTRGKVLFLVDMSGSMSGPRIATLKQELKKALGLDQSGKRTPGGSFIIIGFNTQTIKFPANGMARYRNAQNMADAENFIDQRLQPGGGTHMTPAWQEALQEAKTHQLTAIYFLTDGEGELTTQSLLALIDGAGVGDLKVNCIAIGHDQAFMKEVAEKRGGNYVFRQ